MTTYREIENHDDGKQANVDLSGDRRRSISQSRDSHSRQSYRPQSRYGNYATKNRISIFPLINISTISLNSMIATDEDKPHRKKNVCPRHSKHGDHSFLEFEDERDHQDRKGRREGEERDCRDLRSYGDEIRHRDETHRRDARPYTDKRHYSHRRDPRIEKSRRREHRSATAWTADERDLEIVSVDEEDWNDYRNGKQRSSRKRTHRRDKVGIVASLVVSFVSLMTLLELKKPRKHRSQANSRQ